MNARLAAGCPAASYEAVSVPDLRAGWLDHHEHAPRSSVRTGARYRTATGYLVRYRQAHPVR